ncbi:MAG: biopolymer transporter ExbD [Candidatus Competibacteraceae bacterium]|nr:biopolymer transporter ExbD [Candidatus Competibacteraceae bacterium]
MHLEIHHPRRKLIGLTPLIDVVFILLVFFMLASSFLDWRAIALEAPAQMGDGGAGSQGAVLIRLQPDGGLDLNGEPLTLESLVIRIEARVEARPDLAVRLQPAPRVELQRLVTVLDRLERTAAGAVTLVRNPGASP